MNKIRRFDFLVTIRNSCRTPVFSPLNWPLLTPPWYNASTCLKAMQKRNNWYFVLLKTIKERHFYGKIVRGGENSDKEAKAIRKWFSIQLLKHNFSGMFMALNMLSPLPRFNYQTKLDTIRIQNSILQFAAKRHAKVTQHFAEQEKMQVNRVTVLQVLLLKNMQYFQGIKKDVVMLEKTHCLEVIILPCSCNPYITLLCSMMPKLCGFYFAIAHSSAVNIQIFQDIELVSFWEFDITRHIQDYKFHHVTQNTYINRDTVCLYGYNNFECSL